MRTEPTSRVYPILFVVCLSLGVGLLVVATLRPFFSAIAWGIVLSVAVWPLWSRARGRFPKRASLLAAGFSIVVSVVVLLSATLLGAALVSQASDVLARVVSELKSRRVTSFADLVTLPGVSTALRWIETHAGVTAAELQAKAVEAATDVSRFVAQKSGGLILGFFDALVTFLMTMFLFFFFLRDGDRMVESVTELLPLGERERRKAIRSLGSMLESIFKGSLLTAIIQGLTGAIGWSLAGLPSVALAGAAMATLSLLPIGGTAIVWAPGAVYLLVSGHFGAGVFLALWGVIVTSLLADNFLRPLLIRGQGSLNTLVVFLGVFGGLPAFGLLGVFIGPIALAVGVTLVRVFGDAAREARGEAASATAEA
jgi:predicted PurR-regulated permease PerM